MRLMLTLAITYVVGVAASPIAIWGRLSLHDSPFSSFQAWFGIVGARDQSVE
ncbi:MAG TPA: hypothetical protein VNZ26_02970 [Vicinamibacterales bacterium]|nr:hypothetical protein [Vicinamibacterales bacterium]